jgi:hypothetical protein
LNRKTMDCVWMFLRLPSGNYLLDRLGDDITARTSKGISIWSAASKGVCSSDISRVSTRLITCIQTVAMACDVGRLWRQHPSTSYCTCWARMLARVHDPADSPSSWIEQSATFVGPPAYLLEKTLGSRFRANPHGFDWPVCLMKAR